MIKGTNNSINFISTTPVSPNSLSNSHRTHAEVVKMDKVNRARNMSYLVKDLSKSNHVSRTATVQNIIQVSSNKKKHNSYIKIRDKK